MSQTKINIEFANILIACKKKAIKSITNCYHPNCNKKSINSHILQKNGILSTIADNNRHVWEMIINQFKEPHFQFKKTGINDVYSFKCFCNEHDSNLFKKIEKGKIDFKDYESCLLFTLRTIYNEIFRKEVNLKLYQCLHNKIPEKFDNPYFHEFVRQEDLGLKDLKKEENDIWNDINNGTKSFVFEHRHIPKIDACLSAFYNYDTSEEMQNYINKYGVDMERISSIFINCFPYNNSSILLMGYNKKDEKKVKAYFYTFFREKEKFMQRYLTNLFLFRCETWVCSDTFHKKNISGVENIYADATKFSMKELNERRIHPLNFFKGDFKQQLKDWRKINIG